MARLEFEGLGETGEDFANVTRRSHRVKFTGGAGHKLAGIIDRPGGETAGPVAVFSHCFTCNKDLKAIVRIARGLAERGIAVLRFDMTGLGGSEGDFSQTNFSTNVADLAAAVEFARGEIGPVTALIGHSFGGAASLAAAGRASELPALEHLGAVVTLAAPSDTTHLAKLLSQMDPAIEREGSGSVTIGGRDWRIDRPMLEDFRQHDLPALVSQIRVPTLLLHSPIDTTVGYDHALRLQSLILGAEGDQTASLVSLHQADHLLAEEAADLAFVTSLMAAFLQRYAQPE